MNPKSFRHPLAFFIAMGILLLAASGVYSALAAPDDFVTVITVNTGQDFNTSMSESCATYPDDCSLRRAIVQARGSETLQPGDPVIIVSTGGKARVTRAPVRQ